MPFHCEGDPTSATYVFVGEAPAKNEERLGRPFIGLAGKVFDQCCSTVGISRNKCFITNVFDYVVQKNKIGNIITSNNDVMFQVKGSRLTEFANPHIERLAEELAKTNANIIVPMGGPALRAICGVATITNYRGSIIPASLHTIRNRKCIPTLHPASVLWGSSIGKFVIKNDLKKVRREAAQPDINPPQYKFILNPTFQQCLDYLEYILKDKPLISVDIEVAARQVSCIAFATAPDEAISIPYGAGGWRPEQEAELWRATAMVLESPDIRKIFQNGMFDIQFLFSVHGILTSPPYEDTMIAQSIMYPEFKASLAFLTSVYTDQPYYKDMVKHGDIEKEDG